MRNATRILAGVLAAYCLSSRVPAEARPRTIENGELKYSVVLPSECRTEEGPGTLEAICAPDFDEAKSAELPAATGLLLEVDAEAVPSDAKSYGLEEFRREVPEAVCGESEPSKVRLSDVKEALDGAATTFTARVTCSEIRFLGLAERQARDKYVILPGYRYRLMARSLSSDADKVKDAVEAFVASFKSTAEKKS